MKELTNQQAMRYSRQIMLSGFDLDKQELLLARSAVIVGVGGLGCAAAQYLVAAGVGNITLVDDDKVELTNLQRQILHREHSIGQSKVASALASLQRMNSDICITGIEGRLDKSNMSTLLAKTDIVLDCSDNLSTRLLINQYCYAHKIALVAGAAIRMEGHIFAVLPSQKSACYQCFADFVSEQNLSCVDAGVLSPVVGTIGSMQATEAIKILCHYGKLLSNKLNLYDADTSTWSSFNVEKRKGCEVCGN
ncbi:molybdopterin-synthase adenylyltransferase MoeB [Glaciecola sp. MH2013]|uniref:HesA/MoeB/ThiF family protein n=1 Tax=Glaciecola sp. MH2013 TaxID=2785524 RepID=UPI00189FE28C|nr:molybdopterin-synthase adenylyltransferase MoeB [Glaciecola sp. MH2013]MBF7074509.1 molybdopterin-synthase adenylyltransferase MoeB [Glaciecola sp. MH2013]